MFSKVFDQSALSTEAKEEMYKLYPNARRAHLKTGGNFPYLCRSAEVNLYVQVSPAGPQDVCFRDPQGGAPLTVLQTASLASHTVEVALSMVHLASWRQGMQPGKDITSKWNTPRLRK